MEAAPRLITVSAPSDPDGAVIVIHGGANRRGDPRVSPAQLSVLRMVPLAQRIRRASRGRLVVMRLLNSRRGWDAEHTPLRDIRWALSELARRFGPELPVCLVGHSLGGRGALMSVGQPQVRGVVALAPWVLPTDAVPNSAGKPIVIIHGDADRIASPDRSRLLADRLGPGARVAYVTVSGGKHAMLSHRNRFDGLAARCAVWILLGEAHGSDVERIASGATALAV